MTYDYLKSARLSELATAALDTSADIAGRLSAFEALRARLGEIAGAGWLGYSAAERLAIFEASALDLARFGFITD